MFFWLQLKSFLTREDHQPISEVFFYEENLGSADSDVEHKIPFAEIRRGSAVQPADDDSDTH
jgi:hypothetical protein